MMWLLLLVAASVAGMEEPSCEELRELWSVVSRSAEASRRTNEIPVLPPFFEGRKAHHHRLLTPKVALLENRVPDPGHSFYAPQAEAFGRYADAWPSQGATKKGAQWWGVPEEVGMFGRFVDFEEGLPVISRDGPDMPGMTQQMVKEPCHKVANRLCKTDEHCECLNWSNTRCYRGRCQSHYVNKDQDEFEYWHDTALPRSKLGLMKRPIRSTKSIFM